MLGLMDLSKETLLAACKGDVRKLPSFIVHDDQAWPWPDNVRPAKGKIHIRRTTFNNTVARQVPVKPGLWVRPDAQEFFIDLRPDQLGGTSDVGLLQPDAGNADTARTVALADEGGRLPGDEGYGAPVVERSKGGKVEPDDLERVARDPDKRGVQSSVFSGVRDTEPVAMGDDD